MPSSFFYSHRQLCWILLILSAIGLTACGNNNGMVKTDVTVQAEVADLPPVTPLTPMTSNKTIIFDDFSEPQRINRNMWVSNGNRHWIWQGKTSEAPGCIDGCLKQNNEYQDAGNLIMYIQTPRFSNGTIETKLRIDFDQSVAPKPQEKNDLRYYIGAGIVFNMQDKDNFYMFRLAGEEGCVLGKMVANEWHDLANPRRQNFLEGGRIKPMNWYTLKVRIIGNNFQCYVNDSPVIDYTDYGQEFGEPFTLGHVGLVAFKCFADFEYIHAYE